MNWFMDVLGSIWGGGMFCAVVNMGINVSSLPTECREKVWLTDSI